MKKLRLILCTLLALLPMLTGCMERIELNKLGIVAGLGVDKTEDGYILTAQILNPASITGSNPNALPVYSLTAEGQTIYEAYQKLDQVTTETLFLSHLNIIVVNEEMAKSGINPILNFTLRHTEIRPDINILVAKESNSADILNVLPSIASIPSAELDIFTNMIESYTARLTSYNLYDVVDMASGNSIHMVLNAVSIYHEHEDRQKREQKQAQKDSEGNDTVSSSSSETSPEEHQGGRHEKGEGEDQGSTIDNTLEITAPVQLRIEYLAAFHDDKLVGFLDNDEAQLYNILLGANKRYVLTTKIEEEYYVSVETTNISSEIKTDLEKNKATIDLKIVAGIVENTYPIDLTSKDNFDVLIDYLTAQLEEDIEKFLEKTQSELKSDILGIGGKAYYHEHKNWIQKQGYWSEIFPTIDIKVNVELDIDSSGEIGNVNL